MARTGAVVVVSSTWRLGHPIEHLRGYLARAGFAGQVVDVTPDNRGALGGYRGDDIAEWLAAHPDVEGYVVLDDDSDYGPVPPVRWVVVRGGWLLGGLQQVHVELAVVAMGLPMEVVA